MAINIIANQAEYRDKGISNKIRYDIFNDIMLCQWNMPYTKFNILYAIKIILPWTFCVKQIIKIQSIKSIRKIHKNKFAYLSTIYQVDKINKYQTLYILSIYS